MDKLLQDYLRERPMLLRVAYKIMGSQSEAEDILQDLYLKIMAYEGEAIENPKAWMIRIVVNTAIDQKRSFYRHKVDYVGSWLPEPLIESARTVREVHDDVSMALMVVLERLNPIERAVFVLRETCDMKYSEIGSILGMTEAACRKTWQRAEAHMDQGRKRFQADPQIHQNMTMAFLQYWSKGQTDELIKLLQSEAVLYSDGGGKVSATVQPIAGAKSIIRFLLSLVRAAGPNVNVGARFLPPDLTCLLVDGKLETVISLDFEGERIRNLYFVRNPDKIARLQARLNDEPA
ncbi:MAG TPA: sigma-70 family RNA polymerase sigma factor [Oligoflexus sp.]|uniref:sigma-70 family RNA polymerase sigma factor n=1 Tax=Oligoflexus sp. TaxID=1971216 RepID=UPI002D23092A|nr:sigma-70 family RNA polymerase sigma factor [Oligoflexus sp.]HYX31807.1 sigma-70 family RNA polymerase sigma factor [Oligoflexus sp.]